MSDGWTPENITKLVKESRHGPKCRGRCSGGGPQCEGHLTASHSEQEEADYARAQEARSEGHAIEDLRKAREAVYGGVWTWERHGDGWALYVDRGLPIGDGPGGPFVPVQHGLNILTVGSDGFDSRGEQLRAFILAAADKVPAIAAERDARDAAWARLVTATKRVGAESKLGDPTLFAAAIVEYEKARDALSALGIDVDALLEAA
jgi:hypothetical protein